MASLGESLPEICQRFEDLKLTANFEFLFANASFFRGSCCPKHTSFLVDCCFPKIIAESKRDANETKRIYEITHSLLRLVTILRDEKCTLRHEDELTIADFVFSFWDFVQDVVCYECMSIFKLLMEIHNWSCSTCSQRSETCVWVEDLAEFLCSSSVLNKSRFRCLITLLREYPSLNVVLSPEFLRKCYGFLSNANLSSVISELLVFDMSTAHPQNRDQFHVDQIRKSIVSYSSLLRSAVNDRLLPAIFRCAELASWFLNKACAIVQFDEHTSDNSLEAMLSLARFCLFNQHTLGNSKTWMEFIAVEVVQKAICHSNLQVRLGALNLISDHPKLSLPLSETDFDLFEAFFYFNMSEQSPAARQKILANFKKLLVRMRESGQIMAKESSNEILKIYVDFIRKMHNYAFECLRADSNFNRRFFALCFIYDLHFQDFLVSKDKFRFAKHLSLDEMLDRESLLKIVNCLEDNYQICQETTLQILKKLGSKFDEEWFQEFLETTLENLFSAISAKTRSDLDGPYKIRFFCHFHTSAITLIGLWTKPRSESRGSPTRCGRLRTNPELFISF
ncbi:hypothetical protein L596_029348 [Steinernema carpocapsae]|uniref:tRNA (32-2'-O)-methyltransferase regulator THADA-like TPR repeats region domain-containing protein n=1 Tax=Steinernema carpocapsae TaxID=34508 RepID=A0A4U5LUD2_STECR|nr:hypothetical protein L596_029348 [Steinernema carpocapsae]